MENEEEVKMYRDGRLRATSVRWLKSQEYLKVNASDKLAAPEL